MAKKLKYNPEVDLTDQQEIACQALVGKAKGVKSEAYRIAYPGSEKWTGNALNAKASNLFAMGKVETRIAELQAATAKRNEISVDYVLRNFKEIGERCMQHEPVLDHEGEETGEYQFNASGANRSNELIGKHLGMFIDRKHIALDANIRINVVDYSGQNSGKE